MVNLKMNASLYDVCSDSVGSLCVYCRIHLAVCTKN